MRYLTSVLQLDKSVVIKRIVIAIRSIMTTKNMPHNNGTATPDSPPVQFPVISV